MTKQKTDSPKGQQLTTAADSNFAALQVGGGNAIASLAAEYGLSRSLLTRIKVPSGGGQFWEVETAEGVESYKALEIVVLQANMKLRSWFRLSQEDAGEGTQPDCSSRDGVTAFGNPTTDESAEPVAHECGPCLFSKFGSDRSGGKGQDCAMRGELIGLIEGSAIPVIVSVPRTSIQPFIKYAVIGLGGAKVPTRPDRVVTELTLGQKKSGGNTYSVIGFRKLRDLSESELAQMGTYQAGMAEALAD